MRSLAFERASVIFNLGALYSQLASAEDRSTEDGIKRAINYYQVPPHLYLTYLMAKPWLDCRRDFQLFAIISFTQP